MQLFKKISFQTSKAIYNLQQIHYHDVANTLGAERVPKQVQVSRDELIGHLKELERMRAMQMNCDILYKDKMIRGFCHLYDGQQAIAEGMESALNYDDPLIGAYRIHCQAYKRGISVHEIIAEMLGKATGATKGKGGSMHYYKKSTNFYGGNGIVGAQVPVGVGLAFALKYQNKKNCSAIMFGDGAANQGQLFEAANMAHLWKLPAIFVCENNKYGMGTSITRSSMNPHFYTRGDQIPGIRAQGNNVFQVKEVMKYAKKYAVEKGPIFVEFLCYRYHGHSMSDPGVSYRTKQQVQDYRKTNDCILKLKLFGLQNKLITEQEIEKIQDEQKEFVSQQVEKAKKDPQVPMSELLKHVYLNNDARNFINQIQDYIRGKLYEESYFPAGQNY